MAKDVKMAFYLSGQGRGYIVKKCYELYEENKKLKDIIDNQYRLIEELGIRCKK